MPTRLPERRQREPVLAASDLPRQRRERLRYLQALFEALPRNTTADDYDEALLPWRLKMPA